jgi:hypothetical protein
MCKFLSKLNKKIGLFDCLREIIDRYFIYLKVAKHCQFGRSKLLIFVLYGL